MNNLNGTTSAIDPTLAAWAAQIRASRAEFERPVTDESDPRYVALAAEFPGTSLGLGGEYLAHRYWESIASRTWPSCPVLAPSWSVERTVTPIMHEWPMLEIWDYGAWEERGAIAVRLEQFAKVAIDELPSDFNIDPTGEEIDPDYRPALGEVHGIETMTAIRNASRPIQHLDLDVDSARNLTEALAAVLLQVA